MRLILRSRKLTCGGLRRLISASMRGAGLTAGEGRSFGSGLTRLMSERMENPDHEAVRG